MFGAYDLVFRDMVSDVKCMCRWKGQLKNNTTTRVVAGKRGLYGHALLNIDITRLSMLL